MENKQSTTNQNLTGPEVQTQQTGSREKLLVTVAISVLLTTMVAGSAVYFWQKSVNEKAINSLERKITSLEEQISTIKKVETLPQSISSPSLSPTPTSPSEGDETANWKTFSSDKGYQVKYPNRLTHEERVPGFSVFLENQTDPNSMLFYIDERGEKTLAERKEWLKDDLTDIIYTNIPTAGVRGFIVEGKVGPGYGQGLQVKNAYIDLSGKELIIGCDTNETCQTQTLDQILSTFKFTD